ncbi:MAG TPA: replicative DNA helicase, partial [Acholeplasmataceae bacterium]|nr:replicative DNA helicase [Acholeplasmataceae bacterium]
MAKKLPSHRNAEQSVLGSIFLNHKKIVNVVDELETNDFFDLQHRYIYEAMIQVYSEDKIVDYTSVSAMLEQGNNLGKAGGMDYLLDLAELTPTDSHLDYYIDLVKDASLK